MKRKTIATLIIMVVLIASVFVGCGGTSNEKNETETTQTEVKIVKSDSVSIEGILPEVKSIESNRLSKDKELFSTIKNVIASDTMTYMEVYYVNALDGAKEKVQINSKLHMTIKLSDSLKKCEGTAYEIYQYNMINSEAKKIPVTVKDGMLEFDTNGIGYFAILSVNNPGEEPRTTEEPTEAPTKAPRPTEEPKQTEAPRPTEAPRQTEAPRPTDPPTEPYTNPEIPTARPTEAPKPIEVETKPVEKNVPVVVGSGKEILTNDLIKINNPSKNDGNCYGYTLKITNNGKATFRVMDMKCRYNLPGHSNSSEYDSRIALVSSLAAPASIDYVDIAPGETKEVHFFVDNKIWYDKNGYTYFECSYDGKAYMCQTRYVGSEVVFTAL